VRHDARDALQGHLARGLDLPRSRRPAHDERGLVPEWRLAGRRAGQSGGRGEGQTAALSALSAGLALARQLLEAEGGHIAIDAPASGTGTIVTLLFPSESPELDPAEAE